METANDKREFTRVPPHIEVLIEADGTPAIRGQTRDVCMNGAYVVCPRLLPEGAACRASLLLGGDLRIEVAARVVRADAAGMALGFTEILGLESHEHLRNLLLLNAEHTAQVEQEFREHIGLRRSMPPRG